MEASGMTSVFDWLEHHPTMKKIVENKDGMRLSSLILNIEVLGYLSTFQVKMSSRLLNIGI